METKSVMLPALGNSSTEIYEAVIALSRSIAGRSDLESLLSGVGESLRRIVAFDYLGLTLHDARTGRMQSHILRPGGAATRGADLPIDQEPAGWVWLNQQPLVIRSLANERRWPVFRSTPGLVFCITTGTVTFITVIFPYIPFARFMGFTPLPPSIMMALLLVLIPYLAVSEVAKRRFFKLHRPIDSNKNWRFQWQDHGQLAGQKGTQDKPIRRNMK